MLELQSWQDNHLFVFKAVNVDSLLSARRQHPFLSVKSFFGSAEFPECRALVFAAASSRFLIFTGGVMSYTCVKSTLKFRLLV